MDPDPRSPDATSHLAQTDLARRWKISPRTLERWRSQGQGPRFLKIGGRVLYRQADILMYERAQQRSRTARRRTGTQRQK
jgi:hypothetical protein